MIRIAFKRIFNQKLSTITTILAMICVLTIVPLGINFAQESKLTVQETIEQYGRGSYDILVRPSASRTSVEKELGVVEENYIGDSSGGISIAEWKEIKEIKDIEIAAPVASLGYFSGNRTSIELPYLENPARFKFNYYTTDGVNKYPIPDEFLSVYPSHFEIDDNFKGEIIYFGGEPFYYADYFASKGTVVGFFGIRFPKNYYLLAAIDMESEGKLTGIDFTDLQRDLTKEEAEEVELFLGYRDNPPLIPILQRSELNIPLYLSLSVEEIDVNVTEYKNKYNVHHEEPMSTLNEEYVPQFLKDISKAPILSKRQYDLNLSEYQNPFNGTYLVLNENFDIEKMDGGPLLNDTSIYYTASKIKYDTQDEIVKVLKREDKQQPPLYKDIEQHGKSYMEEMSAPFMIWQMGTFTPPTDESNLVSSPLGIYSTEDVTTVNGEVMTPTITPGSFIAQHAAGITTLEAAELIKGDKPIDAIRVRVAEIDSYNTEAQLKIERIATDLLKKGYEVDIVAGSSFMELQMDVEGIGLVKAPWTTLGVAQELSSNWDILTFTNTLLFGVFGILWFLARLLYERNSISAENEVLYKLGWQKGKIKLRNIIEQLLKIIPAILLSILILLLLSMETKLIAYLAFMIICLISISFILLLFSKNSKQKTRIVAYKKPFSFIYYLNLIIPIMMVLIISFTLITIQVASIVATISESSITTLGTFTMDATFYLQIIVILTTVFLVFISVSDAINSISNARKDEFQMYYIIGWRKKMIRRHFSKEVSLWTGVSIIVGIVLSIITFSVLEMNNNYWLIIGLLCAISSVVLPLLIIISTKEFWKPVS